MRSSRRAALVLGVSVFLIGSPRFASAWQKSIRGQVGGAGTSVALDPDGDVISGGYIAEVPMAVGAFAVLKLQGNDGTEVWRYTLGTAPEGGEAEAVAVTSGGDVVAAGRTTPDGSVTRFAVVKLNGTDGSLAWKVEITGTAGLSDVAKAIQVDAAGDVLAAGWTYNTGSGQDLFVVKLRGSDGAELWRRTLNGSANDADFAAAMALDANGDVLAAGTTINTGTGPDFTVAKLSGSDGSVLWEQAIDGPSPQGAFDRAWDVATDPAGDVFATGYVTSAAGPLDIEVVKLNGGDGVVVWEKSLDGGAVSADEGAALALDPAGDVVVTGYATPFKAGPMFYVDLFVAKLQGSDGAEVWRHTINGGDGTNDFGYDVAVDAAGDVIAAGSMQRFDTWDDFTVLKLDGTSGGELWRRTIKGATKDNFYEHASAVVVDATGHAIAVGNTTSVPSSTDMAVLAVREEISGRTLRVSSRADDPGKSKLIVVSSDPGIIAAGPGGPADLAVTGATLEIFNPSTGETDDIGLPKEHWVALPAGPASTSVPRGFLYKDPTQLAGPCRKVAVGAGFLKANCDGAGIGFSLDELSQGSLAVNLKAGNGVLLHCALFGGTIARDMPGMFKAANADAPAACAVP